MFVIRMPSLDAQVFPRARLLFPLILLIPACMDPPPPRMPEPVVVYDTVEVERYIVDTVTVTVTATDPELEQRIARLQLQLLEKEAQIGELQAELDEAMREVVRSMARLQTLASRAEAASGMAEAEIELEQLKAVAGQRQTPEIERAQQFLDESTVEFNNQNYGGSLYLANEAKRLAGEGRGRLISGDSGSMQPGEVLFALPLPLRAVRRANVREGPGIGFDILFTLEPGANVVGQAYADQWVRIVTEDERSGWIFHNLVENRR